MTRFGLKAACSAAVLALAISSVAASAVAAPTVRTTSGTLQGTTVGGVDEFLGVPYAAPPVGQLRFAPPQPVVATKGVRKATTFASPCPQPAGFFGTQSTNEDCLYLNVYAPKAVVRDAGTDAASGSLPVMVWIHGGAFIEGEGSDYDGSPLVTNGNVIVVTINYRLGPLGFLASPALDAASASGTSGNYGLMDQQAALRWVRKNAAAFGGDPNKVTVFGESAGGQSVIDQIASPTAAGLFQRSIIESGAYLVNVPTLAASESAEATFVAALGCGSQPTVACLRSVPASTYVALQQAAAANFSLSQLTSFGPLIAAPTLPTQPLVAVAEGKYNKVSVVNGSNHDEFRLFTALAYDLQGHPLTAAQYPAAVNAVLGPVLGPLAQSQYPLSAYASPGLALSALLTDATFSCGAFLLDESLALHQTHYTYEFNDENSKMLFVPTTPTLPYGAAHTNELGYIWPRLTGLEGGETFTPQQATLSSTMIQEWTKFAHTGSPNGRGLPSWTPFQPTTLDYESLIPPTPYLETSFATFHKCAFWAPFLGAEIGLPSDVLAAVP